MLQKKIGNSQTQQNKQCFRKIDVNSQTHKNMQYYHKKCKFSNTAKYATIPKK